MFHPLTYDEKHRTALARFSGTLAEQDLADCDLASRQCVILHGLGATLLDFTHVETVEVTTGQFISRGRQPQVVPGQKRAIVANGLLFGLMRMFVSYQSGHSVEPMIRHTLAEACEALGVTGRDFQPIELPRYLGPTTSRKMQFSTPGPDTAAFDDHRHNGVQ